MTNNEGRLPGRPSIQRERNSTIMPTKNEIRYYEDVHRIANALEELVKLVQRLARGLAPNEQS